ncbi:unnamed protein product [Rhodiola kirilowii]
MLSTLAPTELILPTAEGVSAHGCGHTELQAPDLCSFSSVTPVRCSLSQFLNSVRSQTLGIFQPLKARSHD